MLKEIYQEGILMGRSIIIQDIYYVKSIHYVGVSIKRDTFYVGIFIRWEYLLSGSTYYMRIFIMQEH